MALPGVAWHCFALLGIAWRCWALLSKEPEEPRGTRASPKRNQDQGTEQPRGPPLANSVGPTGSSHNLQGMVWNGVKKHHSTSMSKGNRTNQGTQEPRPRDWQQGAKETIARHPRNQYHGTKKPISRSPYRGTKESIPRGPMNQYQDTKEPRPRNHYQGNEEPIPRNLRSQCQGIRGTNTKEPEEGLGRPGNADGVGPAPTDSSKTNKNPLGKA